MVKTKKLNSLIERLKQGDKECFGEFYDLTKASVYFIIRKILSDEHAAQDAMQEAYISFINSLHRIKADQNPFSYLLTTARNKAIDECKKNSRAVYVDDIETLDSRTTELDSFVNEPLIACCKGRLSAEEYEIVELCVFIGYRRVEVAQMLNKPISTVNWQYHRILKKVKAFYKEVYDEN